MKKFAGVTLVGLLLVTAAAISQEATHKAKPAAGRVAVSTSEHTTASATTASAMEEDTQPAQEPQAPARPYTPAASATASQTAPTSVAPSPAYTSMPAPAKAAA